MKRDVRFPRVLVLVNGAVPVALLGWDAWHHDLGANGVNYAIRTTGLLTLLFLLLGLLVTPARKLFGWGEIVSIRRTLGLYAFFHVCLHFSIFFAFDRGMSLASTWTEVTTRTYLQIGTAALVLMIPLAVTSTDAMITRLGARRWKALHRLVYLIAIGGVVHYYLLVKADVRLPIAFGVAVGAALLFRSGQALVDRRARRVKAFIAAAAPPSKPRFWSGRLRVARIFDETPDVRTFRLVADGGGPLPFDYRAGQYLNLKLEVDGAKVARSYTIASSPTRAGYCEITVKREAEGVGSRHLHDSLREGSLLQVGAPSGRFVFDPDESASVVLIAGGVGITPLMSIVRQLTDSSWPGDIFLVVSAKTERDLIFREELAYLVRRHPNLHATVTLSRDEAWTGAKGRVSAELLTPLRPKLLASPVYVCGPDEMMAATRALLAEMGVAEGRIRLEAFVSPPARIPADASLEGGVVTAQTEAREEGVAVAVRFEGSSKSVEIVDDRTILEASEDAGVDIPFECRSGVCGQCKTKLLEGRVAMENEDALTPADRSRRLILACQARPITDVRIDA